MPLTLYKRGKIWHYRGTVAGRLIRRSTRTANKATAQRIASERENREWKGRFDGPGAVLTFAQAAMMYRQAQKATRFLNRVEDYWGDTPVLQITGGAIRSAAIKVYPNASGATRNRQFVVPAQAIINHASSLGQCPPVKVERFPVPKKAKDYATWEWIEAFMAAANPHLGALACFMFLTGARISEALSVRWEDVNFQARRVLIRQTKLSGEERHAHLPQPLVVAIANIERKGDTVFRYSSRDTAKPQWRKAIKRAGIKQLSFHACRHGFATGLLHKGIDPITTAKRGGWKSPQHVFTTYGHAMDDETVTERLIGTRATQPLSLKQKRSV
jgi:integrase